MQVGFSRSQPLSCGGRSGRLVSHIHRQLVPGVSLHKHSQGTTCRPRVPRIGILPAEAFFYPVGPDWFTATLRAMHAVAADLGR